LPSISTTWRIRVIPGTTQTGILTDLVESCIVMALRVIFLLFEHGPLRAAPLSAM
jgi:hypothetical protein